MQKFTRYASVKVSSRPSYRTFYTDYILYNCSRGFSTKLFFIFRGNLRQVVLKLKNVKKYRAFL